MPNTTAVSARLSNVSYYRTGAGEVLVLAPKGKTLMSLSDGWGFHEAATTQRYNTTMRIHVPGAGIIAGVLSRTGCGDSYYLREVSKRELVFVRADGDTFDGEYTSLPMHTPTAACLVPHPSQPGSHILAVRLLKSSKWSVFRVDGDLYAPEGVTGVQLKDLDKSSLALGGNLFDDPEGIAGFSFWTEGSFYCLRVRPGFSYVLPKGSQDPFLAESIDVNQFRVEVKSTTGGGSMSVKLTPRSRA